METLFRKLRSKQGEVWQLGFYDFPLWSHPEEKSLPFRPRWAACWSTRTNRLEVAGRGGGDPGPETFREVLGQAARAWRLRPERIEVADARLARELGSLLSAEGVAVTLREELPELHAALEERNRDILADLSPPALSVSGVTVERMASFARAAARFAAAAPWRHLSPDDVLVLASDGLPEELRCAEVLAPPIAGIFFHAKAPGDDLTYWEGTEGESREDGEMGDEEDVQDEEDWEEEAGEDETPALDIGIWRVSLHAPYVVHPEDVELWLRHEFPLAHSEAYPVAVRHRPGKGFERPDARLLAWFEAVLAALAEITEEELDAGRWEKEVTSADGPVRLELSLPGVLAPSRAERLPPAGGGEKPAPEELAERLAREAETAPGRRQIHLARRAVALWPGCVNAWLLLARGAPDRETARDLYARAVAEGERLLPQGGSRDAWSFLGEDPFAIPPYVWARIGLAKALWDLGAKEEAAGHLQGILEVDIHDSEQVRHLLAPALLALGRAEEAEDLVARHADDRAGWHYTRALLAFHREGDSPAARRHLTAALRSDYGTARRLFNYGWKNLIGLRWRQEPESSILLEAVWTNIPGAVGWLESQLGSAATASQARKKKRKGRKGGKRRRR